MGQMATLSRSCKEANIVKYRLFYRGTWLGTLTEVSREALISWCTFEPQQEFEPLRAIFAEKSQIAEALEATDDDELGNRWDTIEEQTSPPSMRLYDESERELSFQALYIEGEKAGFKYINK